MVYNSSSEAETEVLGMKLAKSLKPGDVVAIFGEMGAGKTVLVRGIARGLGYLGAVTSPTYTIVNEYPTTPPLFHFDLYRLNSDELYEIGFDDYLERGGICAIEWFENAEDEYDWDVKVIAAHEDSDDTVRKYTITRGEEML